jgi:hypothetical protein
MLTAVCAGCSAWLCRYGFFNNKRIVLYDTLIKECSEEQVVAVLAHGERPTATAAAVVVVAGTWLYNQRFPPAAIVVLGSMYACWPHDSWLQGQ